MTALLASSLACSGFPDPRDIEVASNAVTSAAGDTVVGLSISD